MGHFDEGECLKLLTKEKENDEIWILCFSTEMKRDQWLEAIRKVILSFKLYDKLSIK